jgi:hypothetical protein
MTDQEDRFSLPRPAVTMPDKRPKPAVATEREIALRCARSLIVRQSMKLAKENAKLAAKANR